MQTNSREKQRGFIGIAIGLGLLALFSATSAVIVKIEAGANQEKVALQQQKETPQSQAKTLLERSATASMEQ